MLRFWDPREFRARPWLAAALVCAGLLFLPLVAWLIAPRAGGFIAPAAPKAELAEPPVAAAPSEPTPTVALSAPAPSATLDADDDRLGVTGKVVDPNGNAVQGAAVVCNQPEPLTHFVSTNAEGHFKLPPEADGCRVLARADGFSASDETRVDSGRPNELRLRAAGGIEGVVVDDRGAGVTPVLVAIESFTAAPPGSDAGSIRNGAAKSFDARNGAFALDRLAAGKYVLTASSAAHPPVQSDPIEVDPGRIARGLRIVLPRGGKLAGHVTDEQTKQPIAGAVVSLDGLTTSQANAIKSATSDERGAFVLDGAPQAPFAIRVAHEKYVTRIVPGLSATPRGDGADVAVELAPRGDGGDAAGGIGARISRLAANQVVLFLDLQGPAARAGLRMGDHVLRIDGVDAKDFSFADLRQRLRGPVDTSVVLSIQRDDAALDITVTRTDSPF